MAAGDSLLAGFNAAQLASARREANRISAERLKVYQDADQRNQELHDIAISTDRARKNFDRFQQDGYTLGRDATGRVIVEGGLDFNDEKTRLDAGRFANNAADTDFDLGTYIKNPDGTFTPMIRPKGSADDVPFMPMTVGRSSDPNDTVIKLSTEDLQRQFDNALKKDGGLGGLDNSSTSMTAFKTPRVTSSKGASTVVGASPLKRNLYSPSTNSIKIALVVVLPQSVARIDCNFISRTL